MPRGTQKGFEPEPWQVFRAKGPCGSRADQGDDGIHVIWKEQRAELYQHILCEDAVIASERLRNVLIAIQGVTLHPREKCVSDATCESFGFNSWLGCPRTVKLVQMHGKLWNVSIKALSVFGTSLSTIRNYSSLQKMSERIRI